MTSRTQNRHWLQKCQSQAKPFNSGRQGSPHNVLKTTTVRRTSLGPDTSSEELIERPRQMRPQPYPKTTGKDPEKVAEVNAQLKAKLLEFKKQTEANVDNARLEIGKLSIQAQAAVKNNEALLGQLEQVNQKMQEVAGGLYQKKAEVRYKEIDYEAKCRRAEEFHLYAVAKNAFEAFYAAFRLLRLEKIVVSKRNKKLKELSFQVLKQAQLMHALLGQKAVRQRLGLLRSVLRSWRSHVRSKISRNRQAYRILSVRLGQKVLLALAQVRYMRQAKERKYQLARELFAKCGLQRSIKGLKLMLTLDRLPGKVEREYTEKSKNMHNRNLKGKALDSFREYTAPQIGKHAKSLIAFQLYSKRCLGKVFSEWKREMLTRKIVHHKATLLLALKQRKRLARSFVAWQMFIHRRRKHRVEKSLADKVGLVHIFRRWKWAFGWVRRIRLLDHFSTEITKKRRTKKALRGLMWMKERKTFEKNAMKLLGMKHLMRVRAEMYLRWKAALVQETKKKEERTREKICYFHKWVKFCRHNQRKKFLIYVSEQKHKEVVGRTLRKALRWMQHLWLENRRRQALGKKVEWGHSMDLCRRAFLGFRTEVVQSKYSKSKALVQEDAKLSREIERLADGLDRTEKTRAELIDQLQNERLVSASDLDKLKRKADAVTELEGNISRLSAQRLALNSEIAQLASRNHSAAESLQESEDDTIRARADYAAGIEKLRSENERLRRRQKELSAEAKLKYETRKNVEQELRQAKAKSAAGEKRREKDLENAQVAREQLERAVELKVRELAGMKERVEKTIGEKELLKSRMDEIRQKGDGILTDKDARIGQLSAVNKELANKIGDLSESLAQVSNESEVAAKTRNFQAGYVSTHAEGRRPEPEREKSVSESGLKRELQGRLDRLEVEFRTVEDHRQPIDEQISHD